MRYYTLILSCIVIFSGCSSKEVFEPKALKADWNNPQVGRDRDGTHPGTGVKTGRGRRNGN
jgi:hypothetical protein